MANFMLYELYLQSNINKWIKEFCWMVKMKRWMKVSFMWIKSLLKNKQKGFWLSGPTPEQFHQNCRTFTGSCWVWWVIRVENKWLPWSACPDDPLPELQTGSSVEGWDFFTGTFFGHLKFTVCKLGSSTPAAPACAPPRPFWHPWVSCLSWWHHSLFSGQSLLMA